jgi:hypothetical protein
MIAPLIRTFHRMRSMLKRPPDTKDVVNESRQLQREMDQQMMARHSDVVTTRLDQMHLRQHIRQHGNFFERELRGGKEGRAE